jgi:sugar phosphate isomerase/epimerase
MLVGAMNNPARPLEAELERIAGMGFDFVDLTLEPPCASPVDAKRLERVVRNVGLPVVGHTAYYLPIASAFPTLRAEAHALFLQAVDVFVALDAAVVNVHPDPMTKLFSRDEVIRRNADAVAELTEAVTRRGPRLMLENLPALGRPEDLEPVFAAAEAAAFHLDVGHAHLNRARHEPNRTEELLAAFGDRLAHVHVSDNFGLEDLHLPLGTGTIEWPRIVAALKRAGWDGTVTLEIFTSQRSYLEASKRLWVEWWAAG